MYNLIAMGLLISILICVTPYAFASESNAKRYSDGYSNGAQQAITDFQHQSPFNTICDPTNRFTSGGGHSHLYCSGWKDGYTAEWNRLVSSHSRPVPSSTNLSNTNNPTTAASSNTTLQQTPQPTTNYVTNSFIAFLIIVIVIVIARLAWKIKHRGGKYRKRQDFSEVTKERTLAKQHHRCGYCNKLLNVVDFDHKDNNRSNNDESNCVALCPNCHAIKTRTAR